MAFDSAYQLRTGGMDPKTRQAEEIAALRRELAALDRPHALGFQLAVGEDQSSLVLGASQTDTTSGPEATVFATPKTVLAISLTMEMSRATSGSADASITILNDDGDTIGAWTRLLRRTNTVAAQMGAVPGSQDGASIGGLISDFESNLFLGSVPHGFILLPTLATAGDAQNLTFRATYSTTATGGGSATYSDRQIMVASFVAP